MCSMGRRRGSVFRCGRNWMVLSVWMRSRGIHFNLPPESLCVLTEKRKDDTGLAGRR